MTDAERYLLSRYLHELRRKAMRVGPLHAYWDVILDIEAVLAGERPLITQSPEAWIRYCWTLLAKDD